MNAHIINAVVLTDGYRNAINITVSFSALEDDKVLVAPLGWFDSVMIGSFCRVEYVGNKVRFYDVYSHELMAELAGRS
jgi:hypothetical protein